MSVAADNSGEAAYQAAREWLAAEEARESAMEAYQVAAERVKAATAALQAAVRAWRPGE